MNPVQKAINDLREQGWTEKRIAEDLGVHPVTVNRWVTGCRFPEIPHLIVEKLESWLKVPA